MSDTPGSAASPGLKATEEVLALVGRLLDCVDHSGRSRLSPDARIALVEGVVTIARRVEALRAVLVGEADRAKAAETSRGTSVRSMLTSSGQVSAGEAEAVAARMPLLLHAINLQTYRTPLAAGPGVNPLGDEALALLGEFWTTPCLPEDA